MKSGPTRDLNSPETPTIRLPDADRRRRSPHQAGRPGPAENLAHIRGFSTKYRPHAPALDVDWPYGSYFLTTSLVMFAWMFPFVSPLSIGNDYLIFSPGAEIDMMWSV